MSDKRNSGFLQWLGRQVGYVKKAAAADVRHVADTPQSVVYRTDSVEEAPHPADPSLKLRRTTIDEVIRQKRV